MIPPADSDEIEALVARFIDLRERGEAPSANDFARAHPVQEAELKTALAALFEADGLIPDRDTTLPAEIGRFRVLGEIGRGGMGRVLRVDDPERPGVQCALKLLEPPRNLPERAMERFRREGELLRTLAHPGIVRVLDVGLVGTRPYLVMELVQGRSLAEMLALARERAAADSKAPSDHIDLPGDGPSWRRVASIVAVLARSVADLHRAGIVHRDLKPANVIVTPQGLPVLVDFGLVHADSSETLTHTGDLLGTPQYMSPEQARGERADDRTDVWGLGCVIYELLTLHPPHAGTDPVRVLEDVRREPIVSLHKRAPSVPRDLVRIVERALAHQRRYRTSNADLLAADLEAFCAGRPVAARSPSLAEQVTRAWTFHRGAILSSVGVVVLACLAIPLIEWQHTRVRARDAAVQRTAIASWLAGRNDAALADLARLSSGGAQSPWNRLLEDLAMDRDPRDAQDPAASAAITGWRLVRADKPAEALTSLRDAAAHAPGEPLSTIMLASAAERAGEWAQSADEYAAASRLLPGAGVVDARLAQVYYSAKRYDDSLRSVESALTTEPDHAESFSLLAKLLHKKGEYARGVEAAQRAVDLAGAHATLAMRKILAANLDKCERFDESQTILSAIVDENPTSLDAYLGLAFSYDLSHDVKAAYDTYERAIRLGPNSKLYTLQAWLLSGISRKTCTHCAAAYVTDPSLLDPARAESLALQALACTKGWEPTTPTVVAQVGNEIGRTAAIRAALEAMQAKEQRDDRLAAITRGLRILK